MIDSLIDVLLPPRLGHAVSGHSQILSGEYTGLGRFTVKRNLRDKNREETLRLNDSSYV